ncbi:MAG: LytTR family DNA-binding domain-containing protein [Bacteroidales bacterium]|nr:LytTR family DNA-binding domain-containing protein [Bacteroidales bacterium]
MIRCIAIDDEPLALAQIVKFIERIPTLELVAKCLSVSHAKDVMDEQMIDLLFLDIEMPGVNGMEFARTLKGVPYIIFTTAYPEYAIEGYKVSAVDYLLKPLSFDDLCAAVERVSERMLNKPSEMYVKTNGKLRRVVHENVMYIKGMSEYIQIYTKGENIPITTLCRMRQVEEDLPKGMFVRVHKSFIVNINYISAFDSRSAQIGDVVIPVGETYKSAFQAAMYEHGRTNVS